MSQPIINPGVPFVTQFDGPLFPGKMIRIRGYTPPNGERFDVNFQTKPTCQDDDDIAFHMSVRLLDGFIARNSFRYGNWEEEEGGHEGLPLAPGQQFEMLFLVEPGEFKVAINGRHFCEFKHRIAYQHITHFGVEGDVTLSLVAFEGGAPPAYQGGQQPGYGMPGQPMYAPGQPYGGMPSAPPPYSQAVNQPPPMYGQPPMGMPSPYGGGYQYQQPPM